MNEPISDEKLNAFVDGELDAAESEALLVRMREDENLANRVCMQRNLKSMVRLAYADPPVASRPAIPARFSAAHLARYAAAMLVLAVGLGGGWFMRGMEDRTQLTQTNHDHGMIRLTTVPDPNRVMLHVDSAAPDKLQAVLDHAEQFLQAAERSGRPIEVEVIANSRGLDLLRADYSPQADRIARMSQRHANIRFIACNQSIARLKSEGQQVILLPEAKVAPTAIGEIVTRLQQGWTYVKV